MARTDMIYVCTPKWSGCVFFCGFAHLQVERERVASGAGPILSLAGECAAAVPISRDEMVEFDVRS